MSANSNRVTSEIELKLLSENFKKAVNAAKKDLKDLDSAATSAERSVKGLGAKANTTKSAIGGLGNAASVSGGKIKSAGTAAKSLDGDLTTLATSVTGLAAGFTGLSDAVFGFAEKAVALERSMLGQEDLTIEVRRLQEDYNAALGEGTMSARDLSRMYEDLVQKEKMLVLETKAVEAEANALNGEYVTFAVNIATVATQSAITIKLLGAQAGATAAVSKATKLLHIDLSAARLALAGFSVQQTAIGTSSVVAATGIHRVSLAVKGLYLSLGPIGWAILGISSAWLAWETNMFGVQQATRETIKTLTKLWDVLKWIVPVIGAVDEAWKALDSEGHAESAQWWSDSIDSIGKSSETSAGQIGMLSDSLSDGTQIITAAGSAASQTAGNFSILGAGISGASDSFEEFVLRLQGKGLEQMSSQIDDHLGLIDLYAQKFDLLSAAGRDAMHSISDELKNLQSQYNEVYGDGAFRKYIWQEREKGRVSTETATAILRNLERINEKKEESNRLDDESMENQKKSLGIGLSSSGIGSRSLRQELINIFGSSDNAIFEKFAKSMQQDEMERSE